MRTHALSTVLATPALIVASALVATAPAKADDARFDYVLNGLAYDSPAACESAAQEFGARFTAATGHVALRVACESRGTSYDLRLTYLAAAAVPLVTTLQTGGIVAKAAAYATERECEAALSAETARFQRLTGLTPFASYCYRAAADGVHDEFPFGLRVDAFGEAAVKPFLSGALIFGTPVGADRDALGARLITALALRDAEASFVRFRAAGGYAELSALYYAPAAIDLLAFDHARVSSIDQCARELERLDFGLSAAGVTPLLAYCAEQFDGSFEAQTIGLGDLYRVNDSGERFGSYAACAAAADEIIALARSAPADGVVAGTCGYELFDDYWFVRLVAAKPVVVDDGDDDGTL